MPKFLPCTSANFGEHHHVQVVGKTGRPQGMEWLHGKDTKEGNSEK